MAPERYNRRRFRDDHREPPPVETPEQKLRANIIHLGDLPKFDSEDIRRIANAIVQQQESVLAIADGFKVSVTEQPYKIAYYAALLYLLHQPTSPTDSGDETIATENVPIGRTILEEFWRGFQAFLDKQAWRELRLCIHFFAHLTIAGVVNAPSMLSLLQSFAAVLDEPGVSYGRGLNAGLCVAEGLMRAGRVLYPESPQIVSDMIASITGFADSVSFTKTLVRPLAKLHALGEVQTRSNELLQSILTALQQLLDSKFSEDVSIFPQPFTDFVSSNPSEVIPFVLPSILVPPEVMEMESIDIGGNLYEDNKPAGKKDEFPQYYLSLFDNEVTPDITTPSGYSIYSMLRDMVDIFEVNRKECARLLMEVPRWFTPGTFKPKPGTVSDDADQALYEKSWQIESTVIETILSTMLLIPESPHKPIYYCALITELCKLSPPTIGPAVGKSIRKIYSLLGDGLDVEMAEKFSEWFAVHMSNFNFLWVWKEWIPDLSLSPSHPKRTFMRRAVEYEIRLSYYDRIMKTLPEAMHPPEVTVMPAQAPGPEYDYDDPSHPHYDAAQTLLSLLRGRSNVNDVMAHVETLKSNLTESGETEQRASTIVRSMVVQSLLYIGSRSFSHFLNAMERYLPLLRSISSSEGKADILEAAGDFWRKHWQMVLIVFDKLMQYQVIEPIDVVIWAFAARGGTGRSGLTTAEWQLIRASVNKAIGRVAISKRKLAVLRKEEDDARARMKASTEGAGMDVDSEVRDDSNVDSSPAVASALKGYNALTFEQKNTLTRVLSEFVASLKDSSAILNEPAWAQRSQWNESEWSQWETWGWYRHFLRAYSHHLRTHSVTFQSVCFADLEENDATSLLRKLWSSTIDQD